ncbi:MAG: hypothetical protein RLO50_03250 [Azospirillaceae bacterium]
MAAVASAWPVPNALAQSDDTDAAALIGVPHQFNHDSAQGNTRGAEDLQPFVADATANAWSLGLNAGSTCDRWADRWSAPITLPITFTVSNRLETGAQRRAAREHRLTASSDRCRPPKKMQTENRMLKTLSV